MIRIVLACMLACVPISAFAGMDIAPQAIDTSQFVTQSQLSAVPVYTDAQAAAAAQNLPKLSAIPTAGPGAGKCMWAWVPSSLTSPAGIAGTCTQISMCGTSTTYTIHAVNVGNGC